MEHEVVLHVEEWSEWERQGEVGDRRLGVVEIRESMVEVLDLHCSRWGLETSQLHVQSGQLTLRRVIEVLDEMQ